MPLKPRVITTFATVVTPDKLITRTGGIKVDNPVAFHVALSAEFGPISEDAVIPFDVVKQNLGGGYSDESYVFTAPVAGVYFLTATAVGDSGTFCVMTLYHNGDVVQRISGRADGKIEEWSNSAMIELKVGDTVWWEMLGDDYHRLLGTPGGLDTSFTGFLYAENAA